MKIIILSRSLFNHYLTQNNVTPDNVEERDNLFFISVLNPDEPTYQPFFPTDKENVKVMTFPDIEKDMTVEVIGSKEKIPMKAFTIDQARELYKFIKKHKDKEGVFVHCTAGVSRSGAIGTFINDFVGGSWHELQRQNPSILPNHHVYKLLHEAWYEDIAGIRKEDFKIECINPKSQEQLVAEYNVRHPDQHTSITDMTIEKAEQYGYKKGPTELVGAIFIHADGASTCIKAHPSFNEPEFEQFWLETDKYYGMVDEKELEIIRHLHSDFAEFMNAKKKILHKDEFEAFAEFGVGDEYRGILLSEWLESKNMLSFFK